MAAMPVVLVDSLTVRYAGKAACDSITFSVNEGECFALLGRNGAGKSSLVRCLLGLRQPDKGSASLFGKDAWSDRAELMARVGSVPEEPDAPSNLSATQLGIALAWMAPRWDAAAFRDRLARFRVPPRTSFGRLSKGEKSLVQLALALGAAPDLLVLDDPTLGLDLIARELVFAEVRAEQAARSLSVLITTHEIASVAMLAHRVGILRSGRLVALGTPGEIAREAGPGVMSLEAAFVVLAGAA